MGSFSASFGILWTPPAAAVNSGNSTVSAQGTENSQSVGKVDVPSGTIIGTTFDIPFQGVSGAKLFTIQNMMSSDIGVRLNGAATDNFRLAPGQMLAMAGPAVAASNPLSSVTVVTTASPAQTELIYYWVMGD